MGYVVGEDLPLPLGKFCFDSGCLHICNLVKRQFTDLKLIFLIFFSLSILQLIHQIYGGLFFGPHLNGDVVSISPLLRLLLSLPSKPFGKTALCYRDIWINFVIMQSSNKSLLPCYKGKQLNLPVGDAQGYTRGYTNCFMPYGVLPGQYVVSLRYMNWVCNIDLHSGAKSDQPTKGIQLSAIQISLSQSSL